MSIRCALAFLVVCPSMIRADGGMLQFTERRGNATISLFTSPTQLRAGLVDFSILVQPDQPQSSATVYVSRGQSRLGGLATRELATNKLFRAIPIELPEPGRWRVEVTVGSDEPIVAYLEVGLPPPPWIDLAAWIGWPAIAIVLFAIHQWLAARSRTCRYQVTSPMS